MSKEQNFTKGNILKSLITFALPVLMSLLLQALYGAVDLMIVGRFASTADVSGVATGSQIMSTITGVITGLSMGITIIVAEHIGTGEKEKAGDAIGTGIGVFVVVGLVMTLIFTAFSGGISKLMQAPEEAFAQTTSYVRICSAGLLFITAYNVLGAVFRGIGDSKTPFLTVAIACVVNIFGDLLMVRVFGLGAAGAAYATVGAQAISVIISLLIISKRELPFTVTKQSLRPDRRIAFKEVKLGMPIAMQDLLVGISFMIIQAVVNSRDVISSAGVGVANRLTGFIMLVPSAFGQSMCAFVAQNMGAGLRDRAKRALWYGIGASVAVGLFMATASFFFGDRMSALFDENAQVVAASFSYLRAYSIDCLLTPFLFCFIGYYNGCEKTLFVMLQGLIGAFCVRVPVVLLMNSFEWSTLFHLGLSTPCSTIVQIIMCLFMYYRMKNENRTIG